jgi:hypothetical protein
MLHEHSTLPAMRDNPLQILLGRKLSALDIQTAELFQNQPAFHAFVQQRFDQAFPDVTPRLDLLRSFIKCRENDDTSTGGEPDDTSDIQALLSSLMDAVVQRIVTGQAAGFAGRQARFYRVPEAGGEPTLFTALTPAAFDTFLDGLAGNLLSHYGQYLDAYWAGAVSSTDSRTRKQWLIDIRTEALKNEVALLKSDGLLDATDEALFAKVLRYPNAQARQFLNTYRPCVYGVALKDDEAAPIPLHGAFILTARDPQDAEVKWDTKDVPLTARPVAPTANVGRVLLFIPDAGLEAFESLASLDRELHRRLGHGAEFTSLLAWVADKDQARGLALHRAAPVRDRLHYLERLDSPFSHGVESQCLMIRENLASTLARYQASGAHIDKADLPRGCDRVTDLHRAFDIEPVLWARIKKRCQARLAVFLQDADETDRNAWAAAIASYGEELANLSEPEGFPSLAQFSDRRDLLAYSNRRLRAVLESEYGLTVNPDDLIVHSRDPSVPAIIIAPGAPGSSIQNPGKPQFQHRRRTLTELALENIGGLDFNFTEFSRLTLKTEGSDKPDEALRPEDMLAAQAAETFAGLSLEQVKELVRRLNVGQSHNAFLKDALITSPGAALRKRNYVRTMERQLRLDAIEAKINGDFYPDRLARGFAWVQAVLDVPVDDHRRREVEGHRVVVEHLKLRGQRVRGVLLFRTSVAGGSIVVYTPQAPGGRVFHEFVGERFVPDFTHNSHWREYLVGRVERAFQPQVLATLKGRGDFSMVHMSRIANNVFEDAYETEVNFAINDAAAQVTTTEQTNVETGLAIATTAVDVLTMVLPVRVTLPIGLARSLFSVFSAVEAANLGDRAGAAHHVVRALGEFVGALADGVIGMRSVSGGLKSAPGARGLNPEMALGKKPEGLLPLPGWEGKGIYYRTSKPDGSKHYFLSDQNHWYAILDEGFEEAWRVRDARKPIQWHYSPIRRDSAGHWEIGTHRDAPGLGGGFTERALRDLYPFLDETQARRVFDSFVFPRGRESEFELNLVHYLRSGSTLNVFDPYLTVSPERLRLRLRGLDLPRSWSGGSVVDASRPAPIEPTPGPSRATTAPARPVRPPNEKFADWGQTIDSAELQVQNAEMGIYRRTAGAPALVGRDYVKIDERYFPILPQGTTMRSGVVFMYDPAIEINTFAQFEHLLGTDRFSQPRVATFNGALSRWVHPLDLSFEKSIAAYVGDGFPTFTAATQLQVANVLFNRANPAGLTGWGIAALRRTLQNWRFWPAGNRVSLGDPLSMLPRTPRAHDGTWPLNSLPGYYSRLNFSTDGIPLLLHDALSSRSGSTLRALMIERLTGSRYELVAGGAVSELIFRRPGREALYWLTLRRVAGDVVEGRHYVGPRTDLMDSATRALFIQAQATNNLVTLIGGIQRPVGGGAVNIFILRI